MSPRAAVTLSKSERGCGVSACFHSAKSSKSAGVSSSGSGTRISPGSSRASSAGSVASVTAITWNSPVDISAQATASAPSARASAAR